jgi:uncharacterized protein
MINNSIYKFDEEDWGSLELEVFDPVRSFYQTTPSNLTEFAVKGFGKRELNIKPFVLYEWQKIQYSYLIEENNLFNPPFEFRVNNRTIGKSKNRGKSHLLVGQFSFDDQVGDTKLEIKDNSNKLIFELKTEVFPQKMDYKSDYKAMMADISSIINNLAFDTLKDTFRKSKAKLSGYATENEWWNILDALFEQLILNLVVIKRQPKHEIKTTEQLQSIDRIKNISKKNLDWFRKNQIYSNDIGRGLKISEKHYSHALSIKKFATYNTYENRFIAWAIKNIIERLRQYKKLTEQASGSKDYSSLIKRMKYYQSRLQGILHDSPFNDVGEFEKRTHFSTSLTRGAGYRDFMHIYLLLSRGLELADNDIFKIEQKNISTLYEYWCFFKLVQLIKEQTISKIEFQDLIKIKANKFCVELAKGKASAIKFKKLDSGESTTIYFNREFKKEGKKVYTYNQRPDYSIEFKKNGYEKSFWYLFDAKYRFEEIKEKDDNNFNVPQDAIGQLHRYRDAILHTEPTNSTYRGAIKNLGGIILYPFPLSEIEFVNYPFYKSICQVNIGALPFLPSKTKLVDELLNKMINKTLPEEHFERFIEMDNTEYNSKRNNWKEWVTIGVIPQSSRNERLDFFRNNSIYHIPFVRNLNSKIYLSRKILLCLAGTTNAFFCDVENWEILTDIELIDLGTSWNHRKNKYIAFHLKNINEITTPDNISPINFRYSTFEGLSRYLADPKMNRDCFYLTNPDAARLYEELNKKGIQFQIRWIENNNDPSLIAFIVKDITFFSSDKFPDLSYKINGSLYCLNDLLNLITD